MDFDLINNAFNFDFDLELDFKIEDISSKTIEYMFHLNKELNIEKFKNSLDTVSKKLNIPIIFKEIDEPFYYMSTEIYIIIFNKKLGYYCSHKYYDASSLFTVLNFIDDAYNDRIIDPNDIHIDPIITENKNPFDVVSLPFLASQFKNHLLRKEMFLYDYEKESIPFKKLKIEKTTDFINEILDLFNKDYDMNIIVNGRKNLNFNLHEKHLGLNSYSFYYKKGENLISKLKKFKSVSDLKNSFPDDLFIHLLFCKVIVLNSYLQFKFPSFIKSMCMVKPDLKNGIFITPKDKDGFSEIYISENLIKRLK
jgi:hypothetical protein